MAAREPSDEGARASRTDPARTLDEAFEIAEPQEPRPGESFGRYVLLERIGQGGMGLVYSAYDPRLDRRIALKLLRRAEAPDPRARARLLREAQAIARVRHPNVVTVHDAGVIDDRVYIAMELVVGTDLHRWSKDNPRDRDAVLEIMLQAGRGLAAAHRAGLVHRDFKPGNVLIGDDGLVRVADFGLARAIGAASSSDGDEEEAQPSPVSTEAARAKTPWMRELDPELSGASLEDALTRTGTVLGTPAYMAPEQHRGEAVDAKSDQFAYCVAFFEALWGRRPFPANNPIDLMMAVTEGRIEPPPRGSDVPARIERAVLRGLGNRPEDRWPDMDALLQALTPDTHGRRARWFVVLGAAGTIAALLSVQGWGSGSGEPCPETNPFGEHWTAERHETLREAFGRTGSPHAPQAHASVVAAIDTWSEAWTAARTEACRATKVTGEQSEALLDLRIACYERQRRATTAIVDQLARADAAVVERAADSVRHLEHPDRCEGTAVLARAPMPEDPELRASVERIREQLDEIRGLWAVGRYDAGLALAENAVSEAESTRHPPILAEALVQLGILRDGAGKKRDAIEALHRAAQTAVAGEDDLLLADAWTSLVWAAAQTTRPEDALAWAGYAEVVVDRLGRPPGLLVELRAAKGSALWASGRHEEALAAIDEAIRLREQHHPKSSFLSSLNVQAANALISMRRLDEAQVRIERALAIAHDLQGETHPDLGSIHNSLGVVAFYRGRLQEALAAFERAYEIQERALGPDHPDVMFSLGNVGNLRLELGLHDEALEAMERVLVLSRRTYGDEHRETAMSVHNIASIHQAKGEHATALELYREVLPVREAVHGPDDPYVANTLTGLGEVLVELDRPQEAIESLERALQIREASDPDMRERARTRFALARALRAAGRRDPDPRALAETALTELESLTDDTLAERRREEIEAWLRG